MSHGYFFLQGEGSPMMRKGHRCGGCRQDAWLRVSLRGSLARCTTAGCGRPNGPQDGAPLSRETSLMGQTMGQRRGPSAGEVARRRVRKWGFLARAPPMVVFRGSDWGRGRSPRPERVGLTPRPSRSIPMIGGVGVGEGPASWMRWRECRQGRCP